jgi:non-specific serine/threonine protein kinase
MLESIRTYALDRLTECDQATNARRRHAAYYFSLAEAPGFGRPQERVWMDRLEQEHDNLRVALAWAVEHVPERIVRLADELGWFWHNRGYVREGRRWLELALARAPGVPTPDRARALAMIGFLAREMDDLAIAQSLLEESVQLYQQFGDLDGQAEALNKLSMIALSRGDCLTTDRLASQSVAMFRSIGHQDGVSGALLLVGDAAYLMHDYKGAQAAYTEGLSLAQEAGRVRSVTRRMIRVGQVAQARGAPAQAAAQIVEALRLSRQANDKWGTTMALAALASTAVVLGNPLLAARLLAATEVLLTRSGARLWPVDHTEYERTMTLVRAQVDEATFRSEWAAGQAFCLEQMIEEAIAFVARV